jgi:hypothetical protein
MNVVGGFDVHRSRMTLDYLDTESGQVKRGVSARPAVWRSGPGSPAFGGAKDVHALPALCHALIMLRPMVRFHLVSRF